MPQIRRSKKVLSAERVAVMQVQARRIDADEADDVRSKGRTAFARHERLLAIIHSLKKERERQHLTLDELAARTGIAKPNLSRLENSTRTLPRLDTLSRYAQALGKVIKVELVDLATAG